jgi:Tfp pilus assembly protein PilE
MISRGRRAITLVEVITVISIITVIAALLFPAISRMHESARRTNDLSHLRQLSEACLIYAQSHEDRLPAGRMKAARTGWDDYTWINYDDCWKPLVAVSPALRGMVSCGSVMTGYPDADDFGIAGGEYGYPSDTTLGWIYWGGRDDLYVGGQLRYRSEKRLGQHLTPGSQTLWTCLCWDSAGTSGNSVCPHVGNNFVLYPQNTALKPPPDGLCVALDDGSASFVAWNDMIIIPQFNGFKLYYQP